MATQTPQGVAQALAYGPKAAGLIRRSQYLEDALRSLQEKGGENIRSPYELAAKLAATAILARRSDKAQQAALGEVRANKEQRLARLLAGLDGAVAPPPEPPAMPQMAPPQAPDPMPTRQTAPPPVPVQTAPLPPAQPQAARYTPQDRDALAKMLVVEAVGEGPEGMAAAGHVALNRLRTGYGGAKSLVDVVNAPNQFEGMNRVSQIKPDQYQRALQVADAVLSGQMPDPTGGAVNFLNPELQTQLGRKIPPWAQGQGRRIGRHVFFGGNGASAGPVQAQPFEAADVAMGGQLFEAPQQTPRGLVQPGNIDLNNRPVVPNPDGSVSTVRSISIGVNGKTVLIPTVVGGRVVSNDEAIQNFRQTGQHLGVFADEPSATAYAQQLSQQQAAQYAPSAPDSSPPVAGAPPAATPQAAAGGQPSLYRPTNEEVMYIRQLLQSGDPAQEALGEELAVKLRYKMTQPVEWETTNFNGLPIQVNRTTGEIRMLQTPDAARTRTVPTPQGLPPGSVVQEKPTGDQSILYQPPSGFQGAPAQQTYIRGGPNDPTAGANLVDNEGKLRDRYEAAIKPYIAAREGYQKVVQAAGDLTQAGAIALVFGYMKTLDPGSTVREGEQATINNSGTIPETITNMYNKLIAGKSSLTPEQRAQFANSARGQFEVYQRTYEAETKRHEGLAQSYGYNPSRIIRSFDPIEPYKAPTPGSAPPAGPSDYPEAVRRTYQVMGQRGQYDPKAPFGSKNRPVPLASEAAVKAFDIPANKGKTVVLPNGDIAVID